MKFAHVCVKSLQSCLTLCDPMDHSLPGFSDHGDSPGQNTGVGCLALLQGIFPTQELNQGLLSCRWILYQLSYQRSPLSSLGHVLYNFVSSGAATVAGMQCELMVGIGDCTNEHMKT